PYSLGDPPAHLSFPTRRSSDLQAHTALLLARESIGILGEAWSVLRDAKKTIEVELGEGDDADPDASNPDRDPADLLRVELGEVEDRKSTRLNSSHVKTSYAVFC